MSLRLRDCLLKRGVKVKVVAVNGGSLEHNVDAIVSSPREAAERCADWKSDVIVLCTLLVMHHVQIFRRICNDIQLVGVCHEMYSNLFSWFDKALLGHFDSLVFVSQAAKRSFQPIRGQTDNIYVAPNWLDQNTIELIEDETRCPKEIRKIIGMESDDKLLLISSSVVEHKGVEPFILSVAAPVKSEIGNLKIAIMGKVYDLGINERILSLCPDTYFAGSIPQGDLFDFLRLADVFAHCSKSESFCLAIHEAMHLSLIHI